MGLSITKLQAAAALTLEELIEISRPSPTKTLTATTLSAAAADNSFNDSANGFIAAGFEVGKAVRVRGFTGSAANNIRIARITALTSGKMTIAGTDGDVIVDDAAGESVTITQWESAQATLADVNLEVWSFAISDYKTAAIAAGVDLGGCFAMYPVVVLAVMLSLHTAQASGSLFTVDINENGASILSTKLTIDNTETTSLTATTPAVISDPAIAAGSKISADVDQVGNGSAKGGTVYLLVRRA